MHLATLYRLRWPLIRLPLLVLAIVACGLILQWVYPLPPARLVLSSGMPGGAYQAFAEQYRQALADHGVDLIIQASEGSAQNLSRLTASPPVADIAFVQGGFGWSSFDSPGEHQGHVQTLATIDFEGLWLFSLDVPITQLHQLKGMKVAAGPPGSGHRVLFERLLKQAELPASELTILDISGVTAQAALAAGEVDAVFMVASPNAPVIDKLLTTPRARTAVLEHAAAIVERNTYLNYRLLPQDSLGQDRPAADTALLTTPTHLLAQSDLDPALQRLVTAVAMQIHEAPGSFHRRGELPTIRFSDFPASPEARSVLVHGLNWMEANLPFTLAQVVQRMVIIGIPAVLLTVLLMALIPAWIRLVLESRVSRWYGELRFIEHDLREKQLEAGGLEMTRISNRLRQLERSFGEVKLPPELAPRWFALHQHVSFVRAHLRKYRGR